MKLQETPNTIKYSQAQPYQKKANPSFAGGTAFAQFLRFLDTNQAWGATAVDITCMGIPRSTVDFTRGPDAGLETMRREFSSTFDDALVGAYGVATAWALSQAFNKKYGVQGHKMIVSDETLDVLGQAWNESKNSGNQLEDYLKNILSKTSGYNPHHPDVTRINDSGWVNVDEKAQAKAVEKFAKEIQNGPDKISKEFREYIKGLIGESTGAEHKIKIEKTINGKVEKTVSNLDSYVEGIYKVSKAFMKEGVKESFNGDILNNSFLKDLKSLNKKASIGGVAVATGIGLMLQPINMYLTRKKTGKSGFVGVEGKEPDNSSGFKIMKVVAGLVAGTAVIASIGKPKELLKHLRFKGLVPTIPQYKFIYGFTIVSRLFSARDKNELREASIKDSLGFVNWLILGGFVSKLTAAGIEKMAKFKTSGEKFIRYNANEDGKGFFSWLTKSSIVNRDEVLFDALKKAGISTIKDNGKAMSFKEMLNVAKTHAPIAHSKVKYLSMIQLAGYLYSGLVLGVGIPKLNIAITKSIEKKQAAKKEAAEKA